MTPGPPGGAAPYSAYDNEPPAAAPQAAQPYSAYDDEPPPPKERRQISPIGSAGIGARESLTFGAFPAIHGIIAAGQSPREREASDTAYASGEYPSAAGELAALVKGLGRLGYDHLIAPALGVKSDEEASRVYREERDRAREEQESAEAQNPKSYIAGQLGGALVTPGFGAAGGASALGRVGRAAVGGGVAGGLYGAGEAVSEGQEPLDVAGSAAKGAATGALFGGAGSGTVEGAAKVISRGGKIFRGARDPEAEAARGVLGTIKQDANATGALGIDREAYDAAQKAGMPLHIIDYGGQGTRNLARAVANISPEAWGAIDRATAERVEGRQPLIHGAIHRIMGGGLDAGADRIALEQAARKANRGNYARAYAAGSRPIWSPELERLTSSGAVETAIKGAVGRGNDRAVAEGFGGFRPSIKVTPDGRVEFPKGPKGIPTYPDLRFWDYTQRELKDAADAASRAGRNGPSRAYCTISRPSSTVRCRNLRRRARGRHRSSRPRTPARRAASSSCRTPIHARRAGPWRR
jgi:hypothetical protein